MKRLFLLIACCSFMTACTSRSEPDGELKPIYLRSYIWDYHDVSEHFTIGYVGNGGSLNPKGIRLDGDFLCSAPEFKHSENPEKFLELAERNGDRTYNREESDVIHNYRGCFADNFKAIHLVCLNKDWDAAHPAGTLLDDITKVTVTTFGDYIRNGYTGDRERVVEKYLKDLTEEDLAMIGIGHSSYWPYLVVDTYPFDLDDCEMQVTMVTTEGVEKVLTLKKSEDE